MKLRLVHLATSKDFFGLYDVAVLVNGKEYSYTVRTKYEVDRFVKVMRYQPGKALNLLKKGNISERQ